MITRIGKIPKEGVNIEFDVDNIHLKVKEVTGRRIEEVEVTIFKE